MAPPRLLKPCRSPRVGCRGTVRRVRTYFAHRPGFPHAPVGQAYGYLYRTVLRQASMLAYIDDFALMGLVTLGIIPFVFLLKAKRPEKGAHVVLE